RWSSVRSPWLEKAPSLPAELLSVGASREGVVGGLGAIVRRGARVAALEAIEGLDDGARAEQLGLADQGVLSVFRADGHLLLEQDRTVVEVLVHEVDGRAGLVLAVGENLEAREPAAVAREQRAVDVDATQAGGGGDTALETP